MKVPAFSILILLSAALISFSSAQDSGFPVLKGPYLGQKAPGADPEIFAPGIVSLPECVEYSGTFSPDGREYYFYRFSDTIPATIYGCQIIGEEWTNPEPVVFSAGHPAYEPHITFDNTSLFFAWNKGPGLPGIWVTKRQPEGWSEPTYAGQGMFVSSDSRGYLYVTDMSSLGIDGRTYLAEVTVNNGLFTGYQRLNIVAHYGTQAHPCIAPDGSYLIFDVQDGNYLYLCFRNQDGTWGEAIDLTNHGYDPMAGGATISPDGKYMFFCLNGDIWWISTSFIDKLRPAQGELTYAVTPSGGNSDNVGIFLINADGSGKTQLLDLPGRPCGPAFSPDATEIAFYIHHDPQNWSLYKMKADGTNVIRLTDNTNTSDWSPEWSPDGGCIAFTRIFHSPSMRSEIWIMKPDGSDQERFGDFDGQGPDWSPDGSKLVFFNYFEGGGDIWIVDSNGDNLTKLTDNPSEDWWPQFSPDGSKIAFQSKREGNHDIYVMNADGTNLVQLTNDPADDEDPNWSTDGSRIAFISMRDGHYEIYVMNADGSNQTRVTKTNGNAIDPDWWPIIAQ